MTDLNEQNFFDNIGGGAGAPSAALKVVDDFVYGEIVEQFMMEATDYSTKKPKVDSKTGKTIMQLGVVLQTELRNWSGVSKVPFVDKDDESKGHKPPAEDDGRRTVYVEPWTNIHAAVGKAVEDGTGKKGPLLNGGTLGVQITELRNTGKGNPLKIHRAKYVAPAVSSPDASFFQETAQPAAQAAPAAQPAEQAPAPAQQAPVAAPATQGDPWATPAASGTSKPPF